MSKILSVLSLESWTKGASARDADGNEVRVGDEKATHFSLGGAFLKAYAGETNKDIVENFPLLKQTVLDYAEEKGIVLKELNILKFNDSKRVKWADILEVIKRSGL